MQVRTILNLFLAISLIFVFSVSPAKEIFFLKDMTFDKVKSIAKKNGMLIFVDCYTTWCGPCKWMDQNVYNNDTIADFFNINFLAVKFDMEKGEGLKIAQDYNVRAYPTMLFLDGNGEMVHRIIGAKKPKILLAEALKAKDPKDNLAATIVKYESGEQEPEFIAEYLYALAKAGMPIEEQVNEYLKTIPDDALLEELNWKLVTTYVHDPATPKLRYVHANKDLFREKFGKVQVDEVLEKHFLYTTVELISAEEFNSGAWEEHMDAIVNSGIESPGSVVYRSKLHLCETNKDYNGYGYVCMEGIRKYEWDLANPLNTRAWDVYEFASDKEILEDALNWIDRSLEINRNSFNLDTKAALLYKLDRLDEAIEHCVLSINAAKKEKKQHMYIHKQFLNILIAYKASGGSEVKQKHPAEEDLQVNK